MLNVKRMTDSEKATFKKNAEYRDILNKLNNYLIDCLGYSEEDCKEMTKVEMLWIINDGGLLEDFNSFIK